MQPEEASPMAKTLSVLGIDMAKQVLEIRLSGEHVAM
jgi:hypothetical protein